MIAKFITLLLLCSTVVAGEWTHDELRQFKAAEAYQGAAVDEEHFYAITNHAIGKYRKDTGERVAAWDGGGGGRIKHLNAGVVLEGRLYCAHSNFPGGPEQSSVEIWDAADLQHIGAHHFENPPGSLTWVDRRNGEWFACFAHYRITSDPALSRVMKFDANWKPLATWTFPAKLIARFAGNSSSGGTFGPSGHLFVTGHDATELYVLDVPDKDGELIWRDTIPISAAGQAFAWDSQELGVLYSIQRKTREVIVSRISSKLAGKPGGGSSLAQTPKPNPATNDHVGKLAADLSPTREIVYKKVADRELHLHIFNPAGWQATDKRACFITIHGGGWTGGDPKRIYPFADHYAKLGLVGISVQYRLYNPKTQTTVFDCVKDARSAVRYVRAHAAELGVDPQKIIVSGGSAGGHLAVATAVFDGVDESGEDTKVSPVPNALVLLFPVIDTSKEGYGNAKIGERWRELSPAHNVRAALPPTITFHGTGDTVTPFKGAQMFHETMLKAGNRSELVVNEGGAHGYLMRTQPLYDECLGKSDVFLISLGMLERR